MYAFPSACPSLHLTSSLVSLRLEHLVRGSYQPYGDDQYVTFIGEEHDGVPSYDCAGSADRRWHRTRLTCVAPTNVHVMLCLRRATSNLKITAIVRGMDVGMEESVSVVVGVRGGSTLTANASRKRKQADGINTLSLEPHASKLAALAETGDSLFNEDTASLAALPLPLPLPLSPASPATFMLTPPPPAPAVPDLSQCCCAAPPATSAGDNTGDAPACCDPSSSDMQCCATTTGTTDPATCAELCTLRMLPALGDDLGVLDWAA